MTLLAGPTASGPTASGPVVAPPVRPGRRVPGTVPVFVLGVAVGALASAYTVSTGTNLDYGDGLAHLIISRRVLDSADPGAAQLGTVWLPVPHLLLLPLVQSMWLFRTGVAACVLGALCLGVIAAACWRIGARLGLPPLARAATLVVLLANPSLLYLSTTPLTEPVLLATMTASVAGLAGWIFAPRRLSGGELAVFAGVPAALAVLTRYEGWAATMAGAAAVVIVVLRRGEGWRRALALASSYLAPTVLAVGWWLAHNQVVAGSPTAFLTGPYSAAAFNARFEERGQLTTAGNLGLSTQVLGWGTLETVGLGILLLGAAGLLVVTWQWGLDDRALVVWLLAAPMAFLLVALAAGRHVMLNEMSVPAGVYNSRNVVAAVPWVAVLVGCLVAALPHRPRDLRPAGLVVVAAVTALQCGWWAGDPGARMGVIEEAEGQHREYAGVREVAAVLRAEYDGGRILMDDNAGKLVIAPLVGVPLERYLDRSAGADFEAALEDPSLATWVVMHDQQLGDDASTDAGLDRVTEELGDDRQFRARFRLVADAGGVGLWRRETAS